MQYFAFLEDQLYTLSMKKRLSCFAQGIECEKKILQPRREGMEELWLTPLQRKYWMIYRGPGFLAVI